jgi:hypothetical protein
MPHLCKSVLSEFPGASRDNIVAFALTLLALNLMPGKKDLNSVLT